MGEGVVEGGGRGRGEVERERERGEVEGRHTCIGA